MKNHDIKTASQDELIEDLKSLIDCLKNIFHFDKVTLLGHSVGTVLGIDFIEKNPEYVENYIGVSQICNFKAAVRTGLDKGMNHLKLSSVDKNDIEKIINDNKEISTVEEIMKAFKYILKYLKQPEPLVKLIIMPIISPYMKLLDWWYFIHNKKGDVEYTYLEFDLNEKNIDLNIKLNFILGEDDHTICLNIVKEYAKNKENVNVFCIRNCGHVPMYAKTKEFVEIIKRL